MSASLPSSADAAAAPKSVLVTGAGSGFGRGVALGLARRGHKVVAACHIWPQVTALRAEAAAAGLALEVVKLDVLNPHDRARALRAHDPDVLFNNAGVMESGPMVEIPLDVMRSVFDVNVFAALELAQGFAKKMVARRSGRIVWTSSIAGLVKVPFDGAYAASKHAVEAICAALREELRPYGVEVATVNPGAYRTGFNDTGMETMDQWWDAGPRAVAHWPRRELTRQADPAEMIAAMIAVIEAERPRYRTVLPAAAEAMARAEQAAEWEATV